MEELEYYRNTLEHILRFFAGYITSLVKIYGEKTINVLAVTPGREMGRELGERLGRASTAEEALEMLSEGLGEGWKIDLWKDPEETDSINERLDLTEHETGKEETLLSVSDCPLRKMYAYTSLERGSPGCNLVHSYIAMAMETMLERKTRLNLETTCPGSCILTLSVEKATLSIE